MRLIVVIHGQIRTTYRIFTLAGGMTGVSTIHTMKPIVGFLASEDNHGYFRVAWFSVALGDTRTRLMKGTPPPPSELTILGTLWADYDPVHPPTSTVTPTPVP